MKNKKGFTLVEMITVLVILAVIAAAGVPRLLGFIDQGKAKKCQAQRESILAYYLTDRRIKESQGMAYTLTEEIADRAERISCPSGGIYTDVSETEKWILRCSIHGDSETEDVQ